ncbi:hypothetical protein ACFQZC_20770 [Streptacidiphilus monticola]
MSTAVLPTSRPAGPAAEPSSGRVARTTTRLVRRWAPSAGEGVLALALTVVLTALAARIHGNPLHKAAQVSALSRMQLLVSGTAVVVVGVLGRYAVRGSGRRWDLLLRLGAAAVVGVTGGFLGGAEAWALHGTPWPINGETGDNGRMIRWAQQVQAHGTFDNIYPPGMPHIGAFVAEHFTHGNVPEAFKPIYIFCLAFTPVLVFLFWRMLVAPLPAAAIAVLGALTSPMATKPYSPLVAMLLVPVVAKLAQWLRSSPASRRPVPRCGDCGWGCCAAGSSSSTRAGTSSPSRRSPRCCSPCSRGGPAGRDGCAGWRWRRPSARASWPSRPATCGRCWGRRAPGTCSATRTRWRTRPRRRSR